MNTQRHWRVSNGGRRRWGAVEGALRHFCGLPRGLPRCTGEGTHSTQTAHAVHHADAVAEQVAESWGQRGPETPVEVLTTDGDRRDVERGAAAGHLLARVPARDEVGGAGEQAALEHTQEGALGTHRLPVVREAEADRDDCRQRCECSAASARPPASAPTHYPREARQC